MRFVGDIALDAEVRALASGAITEGAPVIVNTDGTVGVCVDAITGGFGTAVEFESGDTRAPDGPIKSTFDSNSNKVVIGYKDVSNSGYGTAVVATIDSSDNSVSFGTPVVFESATTGYIDLSFDSNVNKVVIAFQDVDDSYACKAIIGTVSSTAISFGSAVTFKARTGANSILENTLVFDSNANKTAVFYVDFDDSQKLFCRVISISGTTPSYGTEVEVCGTTQYGGAAITATFDSNSNKVVVGYMDGGDSNKGKAVVFSGSDLNITSENYIGLSNACSFHGATETYTVTVASGVFYLNGLANPPIQLLRGHTYIFDQADGTNDGHPFHFKDTGGSQYTSGVTVTVTAGTSGAKVTIVVPIDATEPSQYYCTVHGNSMGNVITIEESFAEIDVVGTVNKHQSGLTAGQTYFVQTDGTLGTSADSPSVVAGTAISATEIIVKG